MDKRLDVEKLIGEFTSLLGEDKWQKYANTISLFILGKLSRKELGQELDVLLTNKRLKRLHNQLLLSNLANAMRDGPQGLNNFAGFSSGSDAKRRGHSNKNSSHIETFKKIIMSLPAKDRLRLRHIVKENGKRGMLFSAIHRNRLALIPKTPVVSQQETIDQIKQLNLKTPMEWSQDVVTGFQAPLASETFSIPDPDTLHERMLGISREHGLIGPLDKDSVELMTLAVETYLKKIIESSIDTVRYRDRKYGELLADEVEQIPTKLVSLTTEDIVDTVTISPHLLEPSEIGLGISGVNDDEMVIDHSGIDDIVSGDRPRVEHGEKNIGTREELNWLIKDLLA